MRLAALNEVWKAFSLFFASVPEDLRELFEPRSDPARRSIFSLRCTIVVCPIADSDTGTGSKLLAAIHTAYAGYNTPAVVCNISTSRVQGGYCDVLKHHEGRIGDVDQTSSWRDGRDKANSGIETANIVEVVLIVDLHTACTS